MNKKSLLRSGEAGSGILHFEDSLGRVATAATSQSGLLAFGRSGLSRRFRSVFRSRSGVAGSCTSRAAGSSGGGAAGGGSTAASSARAAVIGIAASASTAGVASVAAGTAGVTSVAAGTAGVSASIAAGSSTARSRAAVIRHAAAAAAIATAGFGVARKINQQRREGGQRKQLTHNDVVSCDSAIIVLTPGVGPSLMFRQLRVAIAPSTCRKLA